MVWNRLITDILQSCSGLVQRYWRIDLFIVSITVATSACIVSFVAYSVKKCWWLHLWPIICDSSGLDVHCRNGPVRRQCASSRCYVLGKCTSVMYLYILYQLHNVPCMVQCVAIGKILLPYSVKSDVVYTIYRGPIWEQLWASSLMSIALYINLVAQVHCCQRQLACTKKVNIS